MSDTSTWSTAGPLLLVALLWGCTNPLLNRASKLQHKPSKAAASLVHASSNPISRLLRETWRLISNWQFVLPFVVNQCGSALFLRLLSWGDVSLVVPLTNSLTFVCTAVTSIALGEQPHIHNTYTWLGMAAIVLGTAICLASKQAT